MIEEAPPPQYTATAPSAAATPRLPPAPKDRIFFVWAVIAFLVAAALQLIYAAASIGFRLTVAANPGRDVEFVLQEFFALGLGFLGAGVLLAALAIALRFPHRRTYFVAGGIVSFAGAFGLALAESLLYYTLFHATPNFQVIENYSTIAFVCWPLIPLGLGVMLLGFLRGTAARAVL